jgi:hypothetical protein
VLLLTRHRSGPSIARSPCQDRRGQTAASAILHRARDSTGLAPGRLPGVPQFIQHRGAHRQVRGCHAAVVQSRHDERPDRYGERVGFLLLARQDTAPAKSRIHSILGRWCWPRSRLQDASRREQRAVARNQPVGALVPTKRRDRRDDRRGKRASRAK